MKACIVSIGNELLTGQTVDTNAAWLSGELFAMGIATVGCWAVPDEQGRIVDALNEAAAQGDLILVSGGLGPTDDDLTRAAVASFLGVELAFRPEILAGLRDFFAQRGSVMAEKNRSQAYIPEGSTLLDNPYGTAPGFMAEKDGVTLAVMPGVPSEMKRMFTEQLTRRILSKHAGPVLASGKVRCFGVGESRLADKLGDLMDRRRNPLINCTCGSGELLLHVIAQADDPQTACRMVRDDQAMLTTLLGPWVYGYDDDSLSALVGKLLRTAGKTIALAESCTGGGLAKILTDNPGASDYFAAGWVTYSNEAKIRDLGVPAELIEAHGAVSEPVAEAMARAAAEKAGADFGVGITGLAGPGGATEQKPVGLVYIGVVSEGMCQVHTFRFPPADRILVRKRTVFAALNLIRLQLQV